ncbi:MAG: hypothetical protein HFJ35_01405 [Clostridia bacterium]|nr:hypothetical protein [Clostridia bacterium]
MEEENQNVNPVSNDSTTTFKATSGGNGEKKKGKGKIIGLIVVILLVLAIVVVLIYYFVVVSKPERVYKKLIESTINSYTKARTSADYKTSKTNLKLEAKFDLETDELDKNVMDLINKTKIGIDLQTNNEDKQFLMNLEADYDKENLLDIQMYSNIEEEKTYIKLEDWLDKYIEVEEVDNEFYTTFKDLLTNPKMTSSEKASLRKAMGIMKKELTSVIKKEYCSTEKEDITVNGKTIRATKNTIKMNQKQLKKEVETVLINLRDNKEFIECFEDGDELEEILDNLLDQVEEMAEDDESTIEINIYTKGFMQEIQKVTIIFEDEYEEAGMIAITKTASKTYEIDFLDREDKSVAALELKIEEKNKNEGIISYELTVPDFGKAKLTLEYSQKLNEEIEEVKIRNSVKIDELTSEDQQTVMNNLQKSKLYELIMSYVNASTSNVLDTDTKNNIYDTEDDNITTTVEENQIISYDNKTKITFKVPEGYQLERRISDNLGVLRKDDITISVLTDYRDSDEYYRTIEKEKQFYEGEEDYKNIDLSEIRTQEVNGVTFYAARLSCEYDSMGYTTKFEKMYIWTGISDEMVLTFEIDGSENLTQGELKEVLAVNIEKNN